MMVRCKKIQKKKMNWRKKVSSVWKNLVLKYLYIPFVYVTEIVKHEEKDFKFEEFSKRYEAMNLLP